MRLQLNCLLRLFLHLLNKSIDVQPFATHSSGNSFSAYDSCMKEFILDAKPHGRFTSIHSCMGPMPAETTIWPHVDIQRHFFSCVTSISACNNTASGSHQGNLQHLTQFPHVACAMAGQSADGQRDSTKGRNGRLQLFRCNRKPVNRSGVPTVVPSLQWQWQCLPTHGLGKGVFASSEIMKETKHDILLDGLGEIGKIISNHEPPPV